MIHPMILLCRCIPEDTTIVDGDLLDKIHLVLSATSIFHARNRDDIFKLLTTVFVEMELVCIETISGSEKLSIKQGSTTREVVSYYGK